ncbi:hypothetical protein BMF94_6110 [Rhodotorula taiwanensis]|uniref:Uncharacterized protein n=1 Tax=Rhodotorula taiwanensis TaxID=741276 RepID=A0A2S5B2B8_9BASI|nr:hypothetical protein BMF94_6110 [Rhodotorula taiwanensis]
MAYNGYHYGPGGGGGGGGMNPYGGEDYAEHLAQGAGQPRYSEDPFAGGSAEPYSSLPMGEDPEMVDLSGRQRPLSGGAVSSDAGASSAYWQPGARGSVGGVAGYEGAEDWEDGAGQDSLWRRKRWALVAGIVGAIVALAIALGVGLGVGLNKSNGSNKDNAARLSNGQSSSGDPRQSVSVGTFLYTSTLSNGAPTTFTSSAPTSSTAAAAASSSSSLAASSSSSSQAAASSYVVSFPTSTNRAASHAGMSNLSSTEAASLTSSSPAISASSSSTSDPASSLSAPVSSALVSASTESTATSSAALPSSTSTDSPRIRVKFEPELEFKLERGRQLQLGRVKQFLLVVSRGLVEQLRVFVIVHFGRKQFLIEQLASSSSAVSSSSASSTAAQASTTRPPTSTDSNGGSYVFTTRPIVNPGGFTIGTLTGYVTVTAA